MDGFGFHNWFLKSLLPNIPPKSLIVMDNASYHSMTTIPKSNNRIGEMKDWLQKNKISFSSTLKKKDIWQIIKGQKSNFEHYVIDKIARNNGHEILRLPPYHCDLNPIELVSYNYGCRIHYAFRLMYILLRKSITVFYEGVGSCQRLRS